jgi:hypothetical protein
MNPLLLMPAFIAALIGTCSGWVTGYCIRSRRVVGGSRIFSVVLAVLAWFTFIGGLIYWHASVEPRLDGSEGAGVGFGWVLVHVWGAALALMFTGIAIGLRLCPNRIREFHKTNKSCEATGDNASG